MARTICYVSILALGLLGCSHAPLSKAQLQGCDVQDSSLERVLKNIGSNKENVGGPIQVYFQSNVIWIEKPRPLHLREFVDFPNLLSKATDIRERHECGQEAQKNFPDDLDQWKRLKLPGNKVTLEWDSRGCPGEEGRVNGGIWIVGKKQNRIALRIGLNPMEAVGCVGDYLIFIGKSGPHEYGDSTASIGFWQLSTGHTMEMVTRYSGGKACDDGDSQFLPMDITGNLGDTGSIRIRYNRSQGIVLFSGPRGAVAVDPKAAAFWAVEPITGEFRHIVPGKLACSLH